MMMKASTLIIGFLLAAFTLEGMIALYGHLAGQYSVSEPDPTANITILTQAEHVSANITEMRGTYEEPQGWLENAVMLFEAGWSAIGLLLLLPSNMINAFGVMAAGSNFIIPAWIGLMVNAVVWGIFAFIVLGLIFKKDV